MAHPVDVPWTLTHSVLWDEQIIRTQEPNGESFIVARLFGHKGDMPRLANHIVSLHNNTLTAKHEDR